MKRGLEDGGNPRPVAELGFRSFAPGLPEEEQDGEEHQENAQGGEPEDVSAQCVHPRRNGRRERPMFTIV